jgi:hypothetical protein
MFDYFGVLISVIMGLALTHVLRGLAKLIQMRAEVSVYWVHIVWTINIVVFVLGVWFGMFWWKGLESWTAEWFFFLAAYAIVIFMWASMLYPPEFPDNLKCDEYFFGNRRWFFGFALAAILMDIPETLEKQVAHLRAVPPQYVVFAPALVIISLVGLFSRNRLVHAVLCIAWLVGTLSYVFFTSLERIAMHGPG